MSIFTSSQVCDDSNPLDYEGLFKHDRGTEQIVIKDSLISNATVGEARARAELLKGGYVERWVTIVGIYIPNLKQNDIVTFKGINWIVKEISISFKVPKLSQTIKGLRYEWCIY